MKFHPLYCLSDFEVVRRMVNTKNILKTSREEKANRKLKGKKILKNRNVTILIQKDQNGKEIGKYISKNTDVVYDLEKGVMMALLLSEGYHYRDIKQLIERSKTIPS